MNSKIQKAKITVFTKKGPRTYEGFIAGNRWTGKAADGAPSADHPSNWEYLPVDAKVEIIGK